MKKFLSLLFILSFFISAHAATVDTVSIYSNAMQKEFKCVVVKPAMKKHKKQSFPVIYLLHGYSGSYNNWIIRVPEIKEYADKYHLIIVCPDGGYSSWYFDSPVDSSMKYETYIGVELPTYIDNHFPTIKNRNARAITGLSMGGHGALFLAFRHSDTFGACGSMSGGVNLYSSSNKYDIAKRIGDTLHYANNWKELSITGLVAHYPKDSLRIIFDCGYDDAFFKDNHLLHEKMVALKIPHDYIERPGKHNWAYWRNALPYQLLFFKMYFNEMKNN